MKLLVAPPLEQPTPIGWQASREEGDHYDHFHADLDGNGRAGHLFVMVGGRAYNVSVHQSDASASAQAIELEIDPTADLIIVKVVKRASVRISCSDDGTGA